MKFLRARLNLGHDVCCQRKTAPDWHPCTSHQLDLDQAESFNYRVCSTNVVFPIMLNVYDGYRWKWNFPANSFSSSCFYFSVSPRGKFANAPVYLEITIKTCLPEKAKWSHLSNTTNFTMFQANSPLFFSFSRVDGFKKNVLKCWHPSREEEEVLRWSTSIFSFHLLLVEDALFWPVRKKGKGSFFPKPRTT